MTKLATRKSSAKRATPKTAPVVEEDKLASAKAQGQAQFDSIKGMVEALDGHEAAAIAAGWTGPHKDKFGAQYYEQISDGERVTWCAASWKELCAEFDIEPGDDHREGAERTIHEDPLSVQVRSDWFQPWTAMRPVVTPQPFKDGPPANYDSEPVLLAYARCFYFAE